MPDEGRPGILKAEAMDEANVESSHAKYIQRLLKETLANPLTLVPCVWGTTPDGLGYLLKPVLSSSL